MAQDLAALVVSLELQTAKYQAGFDQATKRLERFHKETEDSLKGIAELFAGYLSADAILEFSKSTLEASAQLAEFSKSAGVSVEALSALQFAAKAGGVGTDELNTSLKKLNVAISQAAGNATGDAGLAFKLLGVSVKDASGNIKSADQVFAEVADRFASTADGANKVQLAVALFGKAGEQLIPTLDKGSAGLKELSDQAAAAGAIIDGETAEAAKAFNEKLLLLKTTLVDGIGANVERALLPALNALADNFVGTAKSAENMRVIVEEVTTAFKLLITTASTVKEVFAETGDAIGGAAAAVSQAVKGNFKEAYAILNDQSEHASKSFEDFAGGLADTWDDSTAKVVKTTEDTVAKVKTSLGSLEGAKLAEAALKELQAFADGLGQEANKLDAGKLAATQYALAHGKLADALKITGEKGQEAAAKILGFARDIDLTHTTKEVNDLAAQLAAIGGDTATGALQRFDESTRELTKTLDKLGGEAQANGQAIIDNLRQATVYQQAFATLQTNAARINADAALAEQKVNEAEAAGQITSLEAERQLQAIRQDTIAQLQGIKNGEDAVAAASNQPALIQGAKAFGGQIDALKAKTDTLTKSVRDGLEGAFANNFSDLITGAKSFGDAITGLLKDVEKQFADLISKNLAQQLFGAATGGSSGGPLGGLAGSLAGLFGGAHANGGNIPAGKIGIVGENGPELVMGAAGGGTNVEPNVRAGGTTVNNFNFHVDAPNGQISRPSQAQAAAALQRTLVQNSRRNN